MQSRIAAAVCMVPQVCKKPQASSCLVERPQIPFEAPQRGPIKGYMVHVDEEPLLWKWTKDRFLRMATTIKLDRHSYKHGTRPHNRAQWQELDARAI